MTKNTATLLDPTDSSAVLLADIGDGGDLAGWPNDDEDAFREALSTAYGSKTPHLDGGYTEAELESRLTIRPADAAPTRTFR